MLISECDALPLTWTNMATVPELPVPPSTILEVTCQEGYANRGDGTATCLGDNNYSYSIEPDCSGM